MSSILAVKWWAGSGRRAGTKSKGRLLVVGMGERNSKGLGFFFYKTTVDSWLKYWEGAEWDVLNVLSPQSLDYNLST